MAYGNENHSALLKEMVNYNESLKKVATLSAVQKARMKENKRMKKSEKDNLDPESTKLKERRWRQEANRSAGLAFRSPHRQVCVAAHVES